MNWRQIQQDTLIINTEAKKVNGKPFFEFDMEIKLNPYRALYEVDHPGSQGLHGVFHGETPFFCPYCKKHSQVEKTCHALTHVSFEGIVLGIIQQIYNEMNEQGNHYYEHLEKEDFQYLIEPMFITYVKELDQFLFAFCLADEEAFHAPYLLTGVEYEKNDQDEFQFHIENSRIFHFEGGIFDEDNTLVTDFVCECGYEYDYKRFEQENPLLSCTILNTGYYKEWVFEQLSSFEGFRECILEEYYEEETERSLPAPQVVSLDEFRKRKEEK